MGLVLEPTADAEAPSRSHRRQRTGYAAAAVVVLLASGALLAVHEWSTGGTRLSACPGFVQEGFDRPLAVGSSASMGCPLEPTAGPSVVLMSVSAQHTPNIDVHFRIAYESGVGAAYGPINLPHGRAVAGARVAHVSPYGGGTWLVVTVTQKRAGPWNVRNIDIKYRSWWRHRTARPVLEIKDWAH